MNNRIEYQEKKTEIINCFNEAIDLGKNLEGKYNKYIPLKSMTNNLTAIRDNWNNERFEIVVVGEFSTGKSTFINALLRKNVLPSRVTATTATVNFIRHINELTGDNKEPIAKVVYNDGRAIEIPYEALSDYVTEMSKKEKVAENIHHVDLYIDSPYLENGVVLVDTPGLQALNPEHEKITKKQIQKSNASILLFNMEQPGKLTEIKFLRDLSDSIDRIFFVANRLDGIPQSEVEEVKNHLEEALKNNDYQKIDESKAKVYPVSSLKALISRDEALDSSKFKGKTREELISESKFEEFENILETYLFNGDKFNDYIKVPFSAITNYYDDLLNQLEKYKNNLENDEDIHEVEKKYERIKSEIDLRNEQLKSEVSKLKSDIRTLKKKNSEEFAIDFENLIRTTEKTIEELDDISNFENEVNYELELFNSGFDNLKNSKLNDLSYELMDMIQDKINDFELKLNGDELFDNFSINLESKHIQQKSFTELQKVVDEDLEIKNKEIKEEQKKWKEKETLEQKLKNITFSEDREQSQYDEEMRYLNLLLHSTNQTIEKKEEIGKKFLFFSKKGMVEYPNEKYEKMVMERKELLKKKRQFTEEKTNELSDIKMRLAEMDSDFESKEDLLEARKQLREERNRKINELINKESKYMERQLRSEKRKVLSMLKSFTRNTISNYKSLVREMDALKVAEQKIEEYIKSNDTLIEETKQSEAILAEQLKQSAQQKNILQDDLEKISTQINNAKIKLDMLNF